ncbi:hypothetical protein NCC49_002805 [Naganishia albida]|nr:hypothetical protein NCC49_002805 [Naganishia albida]
MPYIPSIDVLGEENLLRFPTSAIFSSPPPDLIGFNEFKSKGVYVPLALTVGAHEIDGSGLATVDLEIDHDTPSLKHSRRKKDREVVKVAREDAWKLGMDQAWVEPEGTCQGDFSSEQTPWGRVMRALTQFLASRSYSYGKAYISHDTEFRTITGLHHHQAFAPHMLNGTSLPESDVEDVETSIFIRDMEGAMKVYWTTVMSNAHGRM